MKVSVSSVVLAALLGLANATVHITNSNFDGIEGGSTFDITWDGAQGPVTLTLKTGSSDNLQTVETITTGASGDDFPWSVESSLPSGDYAIEISDGTDVNYSSMFTLVGADASTTSASSSSLVTATSTSASTSASASASATTSSTASESTSSESTSTTSTSSESTSTTSSTAKFSSTAPVSSLTRSSSSSAAATTTAAAATHTKVPDTNDARSIAAPLVPGLLAALGAALL
ncbi:Ser-Thr-rich glycosyl-phosphatidyl-inositol-anchored membrane family-domain-containing protein [Xylaria intraflava]|nr:Ser-Thr-rich glycosyl-phosphatidyl-inositol-anchored membrane family-domain-containing protein [Xylaria intraflava]